ncbi:MAG: hypothetical protein IT267_02335 [Saprospiraceae bacterium]|nr:hypothetical protein [Saprospiraceae bacterium]
MKIILILTCHLITLNLKSQTENIASIPDYVYCEIYGQSKLFTTKLDVSISYGQSLGWFKDNRIRNEEGDKIKFNSMIDAMNYMGERGWEFVQAYTVTNGSVFTFVYILKRLLNEEEKKSYIPYIKRDFKK